MQFVSNFVSNIVLEKGKNYKKYYSIWVLPSLPEEGQYWEFGQAK
jgi:hypothetical protein